MARVQWTAEQNERLLLLILESQKIDIAKVAHLWVDKFGNDITAGAISQHLGKLKKRTHGGGGAQSGPKSNGTPRPDVATPKATPRKSTLPKTPSHGSAQKRRARPMSDEDDSADEHDMLQDLSDPGLTPAQKRVKREPRTTVPITYRETDDDDGGDVMATTEERATASFEGRSVQAHGADEDVDRMSDYSDYQPRPVLGEF